MRSQRSKNSRAKERAVQIERAYFYDLLWLAFLVALSIIFLPISSHADDYQQHEMKLRKLEASMQNLEGQIKDLSQKKAQAVTTDEKQAVYSEMLADYKELAKENQDYEDTKTHIRFKHPEMGDETERKYTHHPMQPLSNFENDSSLDGKLDAFLEKMHSVYGFEKKVIKPEPVDSRAPSSVAKKKVVDPDDVDQTIILSK